MKEDHFYLGEFTLTSCLLLPGNTFFSDLYRATVLAFKYFCCQRGGHTFCGRNSALDHVWALCLWYRTKKERPPTTVSNPLPQNNIQNRNGLASSARSLCSVSNYAESLALHLVPCSSLQMPIAHEVCHWQRSGYKRILAVSKLKRHLGLPTQPHPTPQAALAFPTLFLTTLLFNIHHILLPYKLKVV